MNPTTKRARQAMQTRSQIIETGLRLMAERGYRNTTVDDICKACGVAKGTFYHYFKTKFDLFASSTGDHVIKLTENFMTESTGDVYSDIIYILNSYLGLVDRRGGHVGREIGRHMFDECDAGIVPEHRTKKVIDLIDIRLKQAVEQGSLAQKTPVAQICQIIDTYIHGLTFQWEIHPAPSSLLDRAMTTMPTLIHNLLIPYIQQ